MQIDLLLKRDLVLILVTINFLVLALKSEESLQCLKETILYTTKKAKGLFLVWMSSWALKIYQKLSINRTLTLSVEELLLILIQINFFKNLSLKIECLESSIVNMVIATIIAFIYSNNEKVKLEVSTFQEGSINKHLLLQTIITLILHRLISNQWLLSLLTNHKSKGNR